MDQDGTRVTGEKTILKSRWATWTMVQTVVVEFLVIMTALSNQNLWLYF
jgi:hypothetical protein